MYKLSVSIWIFLGLTSCASVIATLGDTYLAIVRRVRDKAVQLKQVARTRGASVISRSRNRVAPADSDEQAEPDTDVDNSNDDHIEIT